MKHLNLAAVSFILTSALPQAACDTLSDAAPLTTAAMKANNFSVVQKGFAGLAPLSAEEVAERMNNWRKAVHEYDVLQEAPKLLDFHCPGYDIRDGLNGCHQLGDNWCWATGAASAAHFFNPETYELCTGLECQVVGHVLDPNDPTACCPHETRSEKCNMRAGFMSEMVESIQWLLQTPEPTYKFSRHALSVHALDLSVSQEAPIYLEIGWYPHGGNDRQGGHIIWIGGCTTSGHYWVHDPEDQWGSWRSLSYSDILHYNGIGRWEATVHLDPAFSTCEGAYSKGYGTRGARGPSGAGHTCANCGCHPCEDRGHCFACTGTSNKCYPYDCGTHCSNSPCSPLPLPAIELNFMIEVTGEAEPKLMPKGCTKIQSAAQDSANSTTFKRPSGSDTFRKVIVKIGHYNITTFKRMYQDSSAGDSLVIGAICVLMLAICGGHVWRHLRTRSRSRSRVATFENAGSREATFENAEYGLMEG